MSGNFYVDAFFVLILGVQVVVLLYTMNNGGVGFSFPDLAALVTCLSLGGGILLSLTLDLRLGERPDYQNIPRDILIKSYLSVLLYTWGLFFAKKLYFTPEKLGGKDPQNPVNPAFAVLKKLGWISPWSILMFIGAVWFPRLIKISMGGGVSGFGGTHIGLNMPYPVVVMEHLFSAGAYGIVMFGVHKAFYSTRKSFWFLIPVILELFFLTLQGRRQLIFAFFTIFFVIIGNSRKIRVTKFVIFGIFASLFLLNFSTVFLNIRKSAISVKKSSFDNVSAIDAVRTALSERDATSEGKRAEVDASFQNLQVRPKLPLLWIVQILEGQETYSPMYGESTFAAFMGSLPRALRPIKYWWDHASFVQRHYRLKMVDVGDNLVALGVSDFGMFGAFLWGFIFGWFLCIMNNFANRALPVNTVVALVIYSMCFKSCINFEVSAVMPFTVLRNCIILLVLYVLTREFFTATNIGGPEKKRRPKARMPSPRYG